MTKKEFKKAKAVLMDFNVMRVFLGIRLVYTVIAFLSIVFMIAWMVIRTMNGISEATVTREIELVLDIFLSEGGAFPALKVFGAYGYGVVPMFGGNGNLSLVVGLATYILGFVITISLFKALKNTKENAGNFVWFIVLGVLDFATTYFMWGVPVVEGLILLDGIYWYLIQIVTMIFCFRAIYCASYLNARFTQGTALKMRELKKIYNETASEE